MVLTGVGLRRGGVTEIYSTTGRSDTGPAKEQKVILTGRGVTGQRKILGGVQSAQFQEGI